MAKRNGKKFRRKGKNVGQPNSTIKKVRVPKIAPTKTAVPAPHVPLTDPDEPIASEPETESNRGSAQGKEKEREKAKHLSGFIFMCNPNTKLECYQYRVFGLPSGKKEVIEDIKPGTKLFLFDFELKLLYGIYEATSAGKLNLEPAAFRGKFPAQVKFKIFKECLPLPESSLRHVIKENYIGFKFKQELSVKQVKKLLSSFRPLTASSYQPAPQVLANVSISRARPPSAMKNQFKHTGLPAMEVPYLAERQYSRIPPIVEPQPVPRVNFLQHGYRRTAAYMKHINPNQDYQSLTATTSYYVPNPQRPSFTEGVTHAVQEQPYSRYRMINETAPHDQVSSLDRRYRTVEEMAPRDQVTVLERQYHQLPLQREALYQDNASAYNSNQAAPSQYASSVTLSQVHPPYYPLPLQRSLQYQDSTVSYNSNPAAPAPSQYIATSSQPLVQATYQKLPLQGEALFGHNVVSYDSQTAASAQYNTSLVTERSQGGAPISSYYSYSAANRLTR